MVSHCTNIYIYIVSLPLFLFLNLTRNLKLRIHVADAYYQHNNLRRVFAVFVKVVPSTARCMVGETREILIINSMKLCEIEIKLRSNWFSRAIVRSRWVRVHARTPLHVHVCHTPGSISGWYHARHIETKLWTRTDCRIRISRYNRLIMKPSSICRSRRTRHFYRRNTRKF